MTPTQMEFFKMSAAGNDFIVFDNRARALRMEEVPALIPALSARGLSVGADGVILLENSPEAHVRARFFNPDGKPTFCGNGSRPAHAIARATSSRNACDSPDASRSRRSPSSIRRHMPG